MISEKSHPRKRMAFFVLNDTKQHLFAIEQCTDYDVKCLIEYIYYLTGVYKDK